MRGIAMLQRALSVSVALIVPLVLAEACGSEDGVAGPQGPGANYCPSCLSIVRGDLQEGAPGEELEQPFVLRAASLRGEPVAGATVTWTVWSGGGTVQYPVTVTDADGLAMTRFTPSTHRAVVRAKIDNIAVAPVDFHTLPRAMGVYARSMPSGTCGSCERYLFYPDSSFALRYSANNEFRGRFATQDSVISLTFEVPSWTASATLRGDSLVVRYSPVMGLSDFEDGVFVLERGTPLTVLAAGSR
jgi:hypothetical protein